jgi:potassium-transporting ATPase KdpC subunit
MKQTIRPAFILFIALTIITGVAYPLLVTGIGKVMFPSQVDGSLVEKDGKLIGSTLIGQHFTSPRYFWGRPSATGPYPYNAAASSGSNLGPINPNLISSVQERVSALKQKANNGQSLVPVDLVTASASGLDPEISPAAAMYQVHRVAAERGLTDDQVKQLVETHIQEKQFGIFGERRVNVLELNLALDAIKLV